MSKKNKTIQIKIFIKENTWLSQSSPHGWGNGYVAVPPWHPLHGKNYRDTVKVKSIDSIEFNENWIGLLINATDKDRKKDEISIDLLIQVHGGVTFSDSANEFLAFPEADNIPKDWWIFGFDTCHLDDNLQKWTQEAVYEETEKFAESINNIHKYIKISWLQQLKMFAKWLYAMLVYTITGLLGLISNRKQLKNC